MKLKFTYGLLALASMLLLASLLLVSCGGCEHDCPKGVCTKCGATDPSYVDALYEIVELFQPYNKFGYSYKDLDGDGLVEMLLTESANRTYAMFALDNEVPALVATFQQGMGYLTSDDEVFYNVKRFDDNGQIFLSCNITRLVGGKLVGASYGWEDKDGNYETAGDEIYFVIDEGGERHELSYSEHKAYRTPYTNYWGSPTRLTKQANLSFNTALSADLITEYTADFSSYYRLCRDHRLDDTEFQSLWRNIKRPPPCIAQWGFCLR